MFLMQVGTIVLIFKHNYIVDQLQFPSDKGKKFIFLLSKKLMIYCNQNTFDVYSLELDSRYKPERLVANCVDYIPVD